MSIDEYSVLLERLKDELSTQNLAEDIMLPAANRLLATIKNRIIRDGLDSEGQQIGNYSTKSMYATQDKFFKKSAFRANW